MVVATTVTGSGRTMEDPSLKGQLQISVPAYDALPPIQSHKRVVLVRHGESTWNAVGRIQGSSDFAVLTHKGEMQAETSRQMLLTDAFDTCFHRFFLSTQLALVLHLAYILCAFSDILNMK
jgi:probable phosphoglycerate mutase